MSDNILLEVVTPERSVVSEQAQIAMAPGSLGEFGVLTGHTPFLTSLKVGTLKYTDAGGQERAVFVSGGFAEALPDRITVLAESAERRQDIDVQRAQAALTAEWGEETAMTRVGGSIPVVGAFKDQLGMDCLLVGFGLNDDILHAPNEKLDLDNFYKGMEASAYLMEELGEIGADLPAKGSRGGRRRKS